MRKLLSLLLVCTVIISSTHAQDTNSVFGNYTTDVDYMFQHLDKSGITSNILYDRVFPFSNLPFFNRNSSLPDTVDFTFFVQSCSELRRAAYTYNSNLPPQADYFYARTDSARASRVVELSVFSYNYHYIDTAALTNNLLYIGSSDSLFYDVAGRSYSPYLLKQTSFIAPLAAELDYRKGTFSFGFNGINYFKNHTKSIYRIVVDFSDGGGNIVFTSGSTPYIPAYTTSGEKICMATVEFTDGSSSINYFSIVAKNVGVTGKLGNPVPDQVIPFFASRGFTGYDETLPRYAQANVGIYYADQTIGTTKKIKKPIIITDGIDFTQSTRFEELYKDYLIYSDGSSSKSLIDELNVKGYDVLVVDFDFVPPSSIPPGKAYFSQPGADYVERNAMVLVDIIEWANNELASQSISEKLVIVGPSMGGLVTRWALRWMELNGLTHNCRLWVSFDAPHRGANIPIGSQYTLEFFATYGEDEGAKKAVKEKLNAPASKEFLIRHYTANSIAEAGAPGFKSRFNNDLETLGWPQATGLRKVSLVNGNLSGVLTNVPEQKSLETEARTSRFGGSFLVFLIHLRTRVLGTESYFTSNSPLSRRVFYGYKFVPFGPDVYYSKVAATPSGSCSIDNSPGGRFDTQQQIVDQIPSDEIVTKSGTRVRISILEKIPDHSFIPTKSGLGCFTYSNWCENLYNRNLACANEIPFDNYYGPVSSSEPHVLLTANSVQWIFNELDGTPQAAPADYGNIYPIQLTGGSEPICSTPVTYQIGNLPSGAIVQWLPAGIVSYNPTNASPTSVTRVGDGLITLYATISNTCAGSVTVSRPGVRVGPPYAGFNIDAYPEAPPCYQEGGIYEFHATPAWGDGSTGWEWGYRIVGVPGQVISPYNSPYFSLIPEQAGTYEIFVKPTNACGAGTSESVKTIQVDGACHGGKAALTTFPNPVRNEIIVSLSAGKQAKKQNTKLRIELVNFMTGRIVKTWAFIGGQQFYRLNVADVKKGLYLLRVLTPEVKISSTVSIER